MNRNEFYKKPRSEISERGFLMLVTYNSGLERCINNYLLRIF